MAGRARHDPHPRQTLSPDDPGQDRALPPLHEKPDPARELLLPGQLERRLTEFVDYYNSRRYHESLNNLTPADVLLRSWSNHSDTEGNYQAQNRRATAPAAPPDCSFNFNPDGPDPLLIPLLTCPKGSDDIQR